MRAAMDNRDDEIEQRSAAMHLNEAARLRYLAMAATTQKLRTDLERRALVHDQLARNLLRISKVDPTQADRV